MSYEVAALRQTVSTHTRSSFTVASGLALMLLGGFLLDLSFMIGGVPIALGLPFAFYTAVIVAIRILFGSAGNEQERPKNASPFEIDSPYEPQE